MRVEVANLWERTRGNHCAGRSTPVHHKAFFATKPTAERLLAAKE